MRLLNPTGNRLETNSPLAERVARDAWLALKTTAEILKKLLGKTLIVSEIECGQYKQNKECIYHKCPLWPDKTHPAPVDPHRVFEMIHNE